MTLDKGKGPSRRWAPGVFVPLRPEPDVARPGDSEQEVVLGCGLGSVASAAEGGAAGTPEGTAAGERQVPASARTPEPSRVDGRYVLEGKGFGKGIQH